MYFTCGGAVYPFEFENGSLFACTAPKAEGVFTVYENGVLVCEMPADFSRSDSVTVDLNEYTESALIKPAYSASPGTSSVVYVAEKTHTDVVAVMNLGYYNDGLVNPDGTINRTADEVLENFNFGFSVAAGGVGFSVQIINWAPSNLWRLKVNGKYTSDGELFSAADIKALTESKLRIVMAKKGNEFTFYSGAEENLRQVYSDIIGSESDAGFNIQILFNQTTGSRIIKSMALGNNGGQNIGNLTEVVQLLNEGKFTFVIVREGEKFSVKYTDGKGNLQDFVTDFTLNKAGTIRKVSLVFWCIGSDVSVTGGTIVRKSTDYAAILDKAVPDVVNGDEEKLTVTGLKESYSYGETVSFTVTSADNVFDVLFNGVPVMPDSAEGNNYVYSLTAGTEAEITLRGAAAKVQPVGVTGQGVSYEGYVSNLSVDREVVALRIAFDKPLYEFDEETQTEIVPDNTAYFQYSIGFTVNGVTHSMDMFRNTTAHNFVFKEYVKTDTNTNENNSTKTMSDKLAFAKALNAGSVYVIIVREGAVYSSYYSLDGVTASPMFTDLTCLDGNDGFISSLFMRNKNPNEGGKTSIKDGVVVRGSTDYNAALAMIKI